MSGFSHQSICAVYYRVKSEQTEVVDGDTEMLEGFKAEMMDMEMRLRNGGLGGVNNFTDYEKRLENAKTIKELVSNLMEVLCVCISNPICQPNTSHKVFTSQAS